MNDAGLAAEYGAGRLLIADLRTTALLSNEARYRLLERLGVPREDANLVSLIIVATGIDSAGRALRRGRRVLARPAGGDLLLGAGVAEELLLGVAGPAIRRTQYAGILIAFALLARGSGPALRRSAHRARTVWLRTGSGFHHRYGYLIAARARAAAARRPVPETHPALGPAATDRSSARDDARDERRVEDQAQWNTNAPLGDRPSLRVVEPKGDAVAATLVAIGYPDQGTAEQAREVVGRLEADLIIQADQVAAITRDHEGKYHVHTTHGGGSTAGGAAWGGFWGLLFGLLFFIPFAGWAVGAGMGALFGHLSGKQLDKAFVEQVRAQLQPGTSALFMVIEQVTPDKAVAALAQFGGTVIKTSLSDEQTRKLQEALAPPVPSAA